MAGAALALAAGFALVALPVSARTRLVSGEWIPFTYNFGFNLYAGNHPVFVVDAYTKRALERHGIVSEKASYEEIQRLFMEHLPNEEGFFNEYHALLVHTGKHHCKKRQDCTRCPLEGMLKGPRVAEPDRKAG